MSAVDPVGAFSSQVGKTNATRRDWLRSLQPASPQAEELPAGSRVNQLALPVSLDLAGRLHLRRGPHLTPFPGRRMHQMTPGKVPRASPFPSEEWGQCRPQLTTGRPQQPN